MLFKFKHILVFIGAMITSAAAPVPSGGGSDKWLNVKKFRQLEELFGPVLGALEPLAEGIDQGVTAGATNANAAMRDAGVSPFRMCTSQASAETPHRPGDQPSSIRYSIPSAVVADKG
jgi:hypothetical protein